MTLSATRALARLARSNIARHRGRSALITLLVLLPVAAMVAAISIFQTMQPTRAEVDLARFGQADLVAQVMSEDELQPYLPDGSIVEPILHVDTRMVLGGSRASVGLRAMKLDGLAEGILTLTAGRPPSAATEAAISQPVAELAGVGIGGTVTVDGMPAFTVVGMVENPMFLGERAVIVDPGTAELNQELLNAEYLIDVPEGADPDAIVGATFLDGGEVQAIGLSSRNSSFIAAGGDSTSPTILVFGALALLEASLIASAAFAVSIRRRQRELGLLAAAGATTRQLAGTVVAEAAFLGALACVGGVVAGIFIAAGLSLFLDDLTEHRNGPLVVNAVGLIGPVAVGFVAALIAAIAPARSVARLPVLRALSGRRPPEASARRTLVIGLAFIALASVMTVAGATLEGDFSATPIFLMMGGAVLGTLGFGACAPWLLERLELVASRLPMAGRIAFRDTARARSRSSPIVTAILSGLAASIAIGAYYASSAASERAFWHPSLYDDQLVIYGAGAESAGQALLATDGVIGGTTIPKLYPADETWFTYILPGATHADGRLYNIYERCVNCGDEFGPYQVSDVAAGTPELLAMARAQHAADALRAGHVVLLSTEPINATTMEVVADDGTGSGGSVVMTLPVTVVHVSVSGGLLPEAFVPQAMIRELDLVPGGEGGGDFPFVVQYDHAVGDAELDQARQISAGFVDTFAELGNVPPERQGEGWRLLLIVLVLLFAISVTGIAIALGEAESRTEQRSLLALGADPGLRRRIVAARAAVLALLAGLLAVPAGLLPVWGVLMSRDSPLAIPTMEIAASVIALPVIAIASAWILSRPIPDWNAFRSVGAGN